MANGLEDWTAVAAAATAVAAGFTGFMAFRTKSLASETKKMAQQTRNMADQTKIVADAATSALQQDQELLRITRQQAAAVMEQASAARQQVELMNDQVRVAQQSLLASSTPIMSPCDITERDELPPPDYHSIERTIYGPDSLKVILPGNISMDIEKTAYPGRWAVVGPHGDELAVIVALRNVGLGPAILESADLAIQRNASHLNLTGLATGVPAVGEKAYVTFRTRATGRALTLMRHTDTKAALTVKYRSPAAAEPRWTTVTYWPTFQTGQPLRDIHKGWLYYGSFEIGPKSLVSAKS